MENQTRNSNQNRSGGKGNPSRGNAARPSGTRKAPVAGKPYSRSGEVSGSRGDRVRISAAQRKKKKKRRDAFVVCVMLLMLTAVAVILCTTVFFKASEVIVNNQKEMYSEEVIADASGLKAGDNMFTANLDKASAAIEKQLPYIRVANVRRKWPDAFFIDAEYAETVLAVQKGNAYIYIDIDGKVLETDIAQPEQTAAVVAGAYAESAVPGNPVTFTDEKALSNLLTVVAAVEESGIRGVTAYNVTNPTDIVIELDHRVEVKLGSVSTVAGKIAFGKEVIAKNVVEGATEKLIIDLTADAKAFVREKEETTVPAPVLTETDASSEEEYAYEDEAEEENGEEEENTDETAEEDAAAEEEAGDESGDEDGAGE